MGAIVLGCLGEGEGGNGPRGWLSLWVIFQGIIFRGLIVQGVNVLIQYGSGQVLIPASLRLSCSNTYEYCDITPSA